MTRTAAPDQQATLRRSLKLWQVTVSGVGIVIGAGIYVLIGQTAREAGSALWISFALAGALSVLTALSYAELAGMFPSAGAEYEFANRAAIAVMIGYLDRAAWLIGSLVLVSGAVSWAIRSRARREHRRPVVPGDEGLGTSMSNDR